MGFGVWGPGLRFVGQGSGMVRVECLGLASGVLRSGRQGQGLRVKEVKNILCHSQVGGFLVKRSRDGV